MFDASRRHKKGFLLIELVVSIALFILFFTMISRMIGRSSMLGKELAARLDTCRMCQVPAHRKSK